MSRIKSSRGSPMPSLAAQSTATPNLKRSSSITLYDPYCWRCHDSTNGEYDFCCKKCRRSFHYLHCKKPKICGNDSLNLSRFKLAPTEQWCPQCQHEAEGTRIYARTDLPELNRAIAVAVERMKAADPEQHFWIGICEKRQSNWRHKVINHVDLAVMTKKAELGQYTCPQQFLGDSKMILHNCLIILKRAVTNAICKLAARLCQIAWEEFTSLSYCYGCYLRTPTTPELNQDFLAVCHSPRPHGLVWARKNINDSTFFPAKIIKFVDDEKNPTVDICFFGDTRTVLIGVKLFTCFVYCPRRPTKVEIVDDNIETGPVSPSAYRELEIYLNALKAQNYNVEFQDNTILTRERVYVAKKASDEINISQNKLSLNLDLPSVPALAQIQAKPSAPEVVVVVENHISVPTLVSNVNPTLSNLTPTSVVPTSCSNGPSSTDRSSAATKPPTPARTSTAPTSNRIVNISVAMKARRGRPPGVRSPIPVNRPPPPQAQFLRFKQEIVDDDDEFDSKANVARAIAASSMTNVRNAPNLISGTTATIGTTSTVGAPGIGIPRTIGTSGSVGTAATIGAPATSRIAANSLPPSTSTASVTPTTRPAPSRPISSRPTSTITNGKRKLSPVRVPPRSTPSASDNGRPQVRMRAESSSTSSLSSVGTLIESPIRSGVRASPSRPPRPGSPGNIFSYDHIHRELDRMLTELNREKDETLRALTKKVAKLTTENEMARAILNDEELRVSGQFCRKCFKTERLTNCCSTVYYCSADCQHTDWRSHSIDCKRAKPNNANENNEQQKQH